MVGIINAAINKEDPFSQVKGYEAERIDIRPEDTVEGRVQGIIDRGGKSLQSEVTRAKQAAGRKGLLNTSMSVGAAERARIDTATPIAMQDARQFLERDVYNQAATNLASEYTAGQLNIAAQQERLGQQELEGVAAGADVARETAETLAETNIEAARVADEQAVLIENLDAENANRLADIQGKYNVRQTTSASTGTLYSSYSGNVTEILNNPKIRPDQKQELIAQQTTILENGLAVQAGISEIDLSDLLVFDGGEGTSATPTEAEAAATMQGYADLAGRGAGWF